MNIEATYWIALAHLPKWGYGKINNIIVKFFHEEKITIEEFFNLPESKWESQYNLTSKDILDLQLAKSELANNAFFVENLINQGYELIPITSPEYSSTLKQNLKLSHSPALLYIKGNKEILHKKSVAIVGSREAEGKSLEFADNIAKQASADYKVVVSGFAKGVDKQALDSAIKYNGQSIIVLPQGITTFSSGFKTYYRQIVEGDVLVLSVFHPTAGWAAGLAMARNPIIYGLADEIFVAESGEKGGTWSGVIDGLRKGRRIFVRQPELYETNANNLLIQKGAIAVDIYGNETASPVFEEGQTIKFLSEDVKAKILELVKRRPHTAKEILDKTNLDWTTRKLISVLQKMEEIQVFKNGRTKQYALKANQPTLFG